MSIAAVAPGRAIAALAGRDTTLVVRLPFLDWTGDLYASLMLDEGLFTSGRVGGTGWFARTDEEWAKLFRTTVYSVRAARARLLQLEIIETRRQGMPKRTFYRFAPDRIEASFVAWLDADKPGVSADPLPATDVDEASSQVDSTVDSAAQSCESGTPVMRKRTTRDSNPEAQSCDSARPSIPAVKSLKQQKTTTTPADAGGALVRAAAALPAAASLPEQPSPAAVATPGPDAALDPDAPVAGQKPTFTALCRAAGWSSRDLTPGNREQLGQLAARILEIPEDERPTPAELAELYRGALGELSDRLGRKAGDLTVLQFRQAIGRWVEAQEREARERKERAETERSEAAAEAERRQQAEQARAALSAEPVQAARLAWQQIATGLRPQLPPTTWATWLEPAQAQALEGRVLTILVPSDRHVDWITGRLAEQLAPLSVGAGLETLRFVAADAAGVGRAA